MENKEFIRLPFDETMVTVFQSVRSKEEYREMLLSTWLVYDSDLASLVDQARNAETEEEYRKIKSTQIPAATISVRCQGGHSSSNETGRTGYMVIDIDGKDNPDINIDQLRDELSQIVNIAYVGKSVGGKGLFCIIPIEDPYSHKEHFNALMYVFDKLGINIDKACDNPNRLRFYSYDKNGHLNKEAIIYKGMLNYKNTKSMTKSTQQQTKTDQPSRAAPAKKPEYNKEQTRRKVEKIISEIVERKIDITGGYKQWFNIGCAFVTEFGEEGREMFRQVSQFSPSYNEEVLNYRYDKCLEQLYPFSIGTFFYYAKQYLNK